MFLSHRRGFTIIDMVACVICGVLLVAVLHTTGCGLSKARREARRMQNSTQIRGIHMGCVLFAQGHNERYPGLVAEGLDKYSVAPPVEADSKTIGSGERNGFDPATRYALLLNGDYFTPKFAISPLDEDKVMAQPGQDISAANFSYAMLRVSDTSAEGRVAEWRATTNSNFAVVTDRNRGSDAGANAYSIHTDAGDGWKGSVAFNDGRVMFEKTNIITLEEYSGKQLNDNLFADDNDLNGRAGNDIAVVFNNADSYVNQD